MLGCPDAVVFWTPDGRTVWLNPTARAMFSGADGIAHPHLDQLLTPASRRTFDRAAMPALAADGRWQGTLRFATHPEGVRAMRCTIIEHRTAAGTPELYSATLRPGDEAGASQRGGSRPALARLVAGMAHDFNNLLTVVLTNGYALESALEGTSLHTSALEIQRAAHQGAAIVHRVLDFTRRGPPRPQVLDLFHECMGITRTLRRHVARGVKIRFEPGPADWMVRIDPAHLDELLTHLISNAVAAMAEGGVLTLKLSAVPGARRADERIRLSVIDPGHGMTPDVLRQACDPLFTTRSAQGRVGMGLAVCRELIDRAGGSMRITSAPGRGTRVDLDLPRAPQQSSAPQARGAPRPTLLLVERDDEQRAAVADALRIRGFVVDAFARGRAALAAVEARAVEPDVIIYDAEGPDADFDGFSGRLRERTGRRVPMVVGVETESGRQPLELRPRSMRLLPRPYDLTSLVEVIEALSA